MNRRSAAVRRAGGKLADGVIAKRGLRHAQRRGARQQRHRGQEVAVDHRRARAHELGQGNPGLSFGVGLRQSSRPT